MRVPLGFQVTEYDCGTASLINAIKFLFHREEVPAEILKAIYVFTLDSYDKDKNLGHEGTSIQAIEKFISWLSDFSKARNFNIKIEHLLGEDVNINDFKLRLDNDGVIILRCILDDIEHFVLLTDMDEVNAYIFDPYYLDEKYFDLDEDVKIILDEPFKYNRIVKLNRLFSCSRKNFSLVVNDRKECVVVERTKK